MLQTKLIDRGVVSIKGDLLSGLKIVVEPGASTESKSPTAQRMSLTEDEYFDALGKKDPLLPNLLRSFIDKAENLGVYVEIGGGLSLKHLAAEGKPLNLATIMKTGIIFTGFSCYGGRQIPGQAYNSKIADLIGGSVKALADGTGSVRNSTGKLLLLSDLLPQHEQAWLDAIETYIRSFAGDSEDE